MNQDRQPKPRYTQEQIRNHRRLVAGVAAGAAVLGLGAAHLADAKPKEQVPVVITMGPGSNFWDAAVGYQKVTGNQSDTREIMDNLEAEANKQNPNDGGVAQPGEVIDTTAPANPNYPPDESVKVGGSEIDYAFPDQVPKDAKQG